MIDPDALAVLQQARADAATVEIVVTDCLYACCNHPLTRRAGYAQIYHGVVANIDGGWLLLHSLALRTLNYRVMAALDDIEAAALISPGGTHETNRA